MLKASTSSMQLPMAVSSLLLMQAVSQVLSRVVIAAGQVAVLQLSRAAVS